VKKILFATEKINKLIDNNIGYINPKLENVHRCLLDKSSSETDRFIQCCNIYTEAFQCICIKFNFTS
jgi:hypothetical protein